LIPAAGIGSRLSGPLPKQYLALGRRTMLEHAIDAVLADARIDRAYVVVAVADTQWRALEVDTGRVEFLPVGGASRAQSVANGLIAIAGRTDDDDRVLVHDAARPCLAEGDLARLLDEVGDDSSGGLLGVPLADTLKRGEDGRVGVTLDRTGLWCAQTPQLFRFASLRAALAAALQPVNRGNEPTDEAAAMERAGHAPRLVMGATTNIKITTAGDLVIARAVLAEQGRL
jgi:2-C-methyl-D-erythritol 4-phosphate cytidylyltransferase